MGKNTQYSVLVVDDEPAIRQIFSRFLERRGHRVLTCGNVVEATEAATDGNFDVIVTDLILPDGTGLDLASELNQICPTSKVILLTGQPSEETSQRAQQLSIYKYLAKPIRAATLIDVVEEAGRSSTECGFEKS